MNNSEAIGRAREYLRSLYGLEGITNFFFHQATWDGRSQLWSVTFHFVHPRDMRAWRGRNPSRTYNTVYLQDSGRVVLLNEQPAPVPPPPTPDQVQAQVLARAQARARAPTPDQVQAQVLARAQARARAQTQAANARRPAPEPTPSAPPQRPASNAAPMKYKTEDGQTIDLAQELGRGGEGAVYEVSGQPNQVAKIWHPNSNTKEVAAKVALMVRNKPDLIINSASLEPQLSPSTVWPHALLYDDRGNTVGFLMPRIDPDTFRSSFRYFNPASRRDLEQQTQHRFRARDQFIMARNLALAMDKLHNSGYVVGDVNEANLLVNNSMEVTFVDADSMQVKDPASSRTFRCTKGREDYTPPRLQGLRFREHDRTVDDDLFGLAVLIFKITMQGVHPYASTSNPDDEDAVTALGEKIKLRYFPYNESGHTPAEHQPSAAYRTAWQNIPFDLRHLFRLSFDPEVAQRGRPSAQQWARVLSRVIETVGADARWENPAPARPYAPPRRRPGRREENVPQGMFGTNRPSPAGRPTTRISMSPPLTRVRISAMGAARLAFLETLGQILYGRGAPPLRVTFLMRATLTIVLVLTVGYSVASVFVEFTNDMYMDQIPACHVETQTGSVRVIRIAPQNDEFPVDPTAVDWQRDGITLTQGPVGQCLPDKVIDPGRVYLAPDGTELDLTQIDGANTQVFWDEPEYPSISSLTELNGIMTIPVMWMIVIIGYMFSAGMSPGSANKPRTDLLIAGIAMGWLLSLRITGVAVAFDAYDPYRFPVFSTGAAQELTVLADFWVVWIGFMVFAIFVAMARSFLMNYRLIRP